MRVNDSATAPTYKPPKFFVSREQLWRLQEAPGDFPIEICRHDVVVGISRWPITRLDDWKSVREWLQREPGAYLLSYRWDDQLRWRHLWTVDDLLIDWGDFSHMEGVVYTPHTGVDWSVADKLEFARAAARKGAVSSKMRRKPDYHRETGKKLTDRSEYMWLILYLMMKRDCTATEMASVLWHSEMSKDRRNDKERGRFVRSDRGERRWIEAEIKRRFRKGIKP
jgi:hypothetical protein